jgi:Dyp-type peroxidase family
VSRLSAARPDEQYSVFNVTPRPCMADTIQGNIVPGFNKDHQAFVLTAFADGASGRDWLRAIVDELATSTQVSAFKTAYRAVHDSRADEARPILTARWTNVALSWRGLERLLGSAEVADFPPTFKTNRVSFAERQPDDDGVHALLILAADDDADLAADLQRHRGIFNQSRVRELRTYIGKAQSGALRGREHFGFKDLVSQPRLADLEPPDPMGEPSLAPGEFILGAPGAYGQVALDGPAWTRYGSYAAFLQLEQHVGLFRETMQREGARLGMTADMLKAYLVGRLENGSDLSNSPPAMSHIGRARPRALSPAEANRHRLLRRGISYGDPLPEGAPDTGGRGLLFLAYQVNLQRQFEQVWAGWLNNPNVPTSGAGVDALVGQLSGSQSPRPVTVAEVGPTPGVCRLRLPQFVAPRYGGYFFAPSVDGIRYLAGDPRRRTGGVSQRGTVWT